MIHVTCSNCVQNGLEIKNRRRAPPAPIDDQLVPLALSEVPHVEVEASIADLRLRRCAAAGANWQKWHGAGAHVPAAPRLAAGAGAPRPRGARESPPRGRDLVARLDPATLRTPARSQPKWLNLGRRLDQAGHGWLHGQSLWTRPRIRALDLHRDDGRLGVGHVGATPAPQVNKKEGACEQRPLIEGTILEWNQAASALHYGLVNACVPAAEALLQMLLPAWHPSRKYKTSVLAPYAIWQGLVVRRAEVVRFQARSRSFPRDGEAHRPG
jgi:hypothetical protein